MPNNKNAILRYQALDACFSDFSREYTMKDLIAAVEKNLINNDQKVTSISKSQVAADIAEIERNNDWMILFNEELRNRRTPVYRYAYDGMSIFKRDISAAQLSELKTTLMFLNRFRGLPQYGQVEKLIEELEFKYGFYIGDAPSQIEFESNEFLTGISFLTKLLKYIDEKKVLCITYQSFKRDTPVRIICHPYFLKQYNQRWFLFALDNKYHTLRNFAIDRIQKIEVTRKDDVGKSLRYIENDKFNFSEYFDDVVGVTVFEDVEPVDVVLRLSPPQTPYVHTKPIHPSQKNKFRGDPSLISIKVKPNEELIRKILSFGPEAEVLEPESLRQELKERVERMKEMYK